MRHTLRRLGRPCDGRGAAGDGSFSRNSASRSGHRAGTEAKSDARRPDANRKVPPTVRAFPEGDLLDVGADKVDWTTLKAGATIKHEEGESRKVITSLTVQPAPQRR